MGERRRPWWWWINPWLYIARRDAAYEGALDIIEEMGQELLAQREARP